MEPVADRLRAERDVCRHGEPTADAPQAGPTRDDPPRRRGDRGGLVLLAQDRQGRRARRGFAGAFPRPRSSGREGATVWAKARRFQDSRLTSRSRTLTRSRRISRCWAATRSFHFSRLRVSISTTRAGALLNSARLMLRTPQAQDSCARLRGVTSFQHGSPARSRSSFRQPRSGLPTPKEFTALFNGIDHWLGSAHAPDRVRLAPDRRGSVRRGGICRTALSMSGEARSSLITIVARRDDRPAVSSSRSGWASRAGRRTERPSAIGRFVGERPEEIEWAWRRSEGVHRETLREPNSLLKRTVSSIV